MTPKEHDELKVRMRLLAAEGMVGWLSHALSAYLATLPNVQKSQQMKEIHRALSEQQKRYLPLTVKSLDAAESDMYMGLFQESFEEFAKEVVGVIEGFST